MGLFSFLPPDPYRQTFRLLEAFLALIWVYQLLGFEATGLVEVVPPVVGLALLILGQFWIPARTGAWIVGVVSSYFTIVLDPASPLGALIGLSSVYMIYNSPLGKTRRTPLTVALVVGLLAVQGLQLVLYPLQGVGLAVRSVIADIVVGVLLGLYRPLVVSSSVLPELNLDALAFSNRERSILVFLQSGLSKKEIACELGMSYESLRKSLSVLYRKLGTSDGLELTRLLASRPVHFGEK